VSAPEQYTWRTVACPACHVGPGEECEARQPPHLARMHLAAAAFRADHPELEVIVHPPPPPLPGTDISELLE
jgi:hypothetical protein